MKKRITIKLLMILVLIGAVGSTNLFGQENGLTKIKGQIIDENAMPLPNIQVKAFIGKNTSLTNHDGYFEVSVAVTKTDRITIDEAGYEFLVVPVEGAANFEKPIVLRKLNAFNGTSTVSLPFKSMESKRSVAAISTISGSQLAAFPTTSFLDALSGLLPGVVVNQYGSAPGGEENSTGITVRGESAVVYVDGVIRDVYDLSPSEVDQVQVFKDFSGRAALGVYGSSPVIWITTQKGRSFNREMNVSTEFGMSAPTVLPEYVGAFDYATLYNEALVNDGLAPYYSADALNAYKNNTDPVNYSNTDYVDRYVKPLASYRRANINFSGGDEKVNYFSMINYVGSEGYEAIGEKYKNDRFKLRANVNVTINDYIKMNVNLSGTYSAGRAPQSNIFTLISGIPSNAHATSFNGKLIVSNDYPINIENSMVYGGFKNSATLGTQNGVNLDFDLNDFVEGLSATAAVAFDASSLLVNGKTISADLYRIVKSSTGADSTELLTPRVVQDDLGLYDNSIRRKTVASASLNYDRTFGKHSISSNLSYYQGLFERNAFDNYQPDKMQDVSLRGNYVYNDKYIAQLDLVYSGSMRMPEGKRFSMNPTIGLGWVMSNESFLKDVKAINFLKLAGSFGIMGSNEFTLAGYNSYYMYQTLWKQGGYWRTGALGTFADATTAFTILQQGSDNYVLPKKQIMNIGIEGSLFNQSLTFDVNYYRNRDYDLISAIYSATPSIYGSGKFLPAGNYGETQRYGFDGMVNFAKEIGDFNFSIGANALYSRGQYVVVDEPTAQEDYRKYAGHEIDEFVLYHADGLFQNQAEVDATTARQIWGEVKPGDIRYVDYNNDKVIDEKDQYRNGEHAPRLFYGLNFSVGYKGFKLYVVGQGVADGMTSILNSYVVTTGSNRNYSKGMLDRWPVTNDLPRLTTTSQNNVQYSSFWLVNAASFRVKNVELSYTLPKAVSQRFSSGDCRVFARGTNLFTMSELTKLGMDTENQYAGISSYPLSSTFTLGVSCKF